MSWWILFHILIGSTLSFVVPVDLSTAASAVLLPLVGILIALAFAWAGNAQALMQSTEIEELAERHVGGFVEYVYTYQLAIFVILITIVLWASAGLGVYDKVWPTPSCTKAYEALKVVLYALSSLTLRECWHVVLGAQTMLLMQQKIKKMKNTK